MCLTAAIGDNGLLKLHGGMKERATGTMMQHRKVVDVVFILYVLTFFAAADERKDHGANDVPALLLCVFWCFPKRYFYG